jgi:hypothetical protein
MCDYSLMSIPNRLAVEGEDLVTYRFHSGSIGFASEPDVRRMAGSNDPRAGGFWSSLRSYYTNPPLAEPVCAVCVPPGARLILQDIPERLQHKLNVASSEEVTFVQMGLDAYNYRDAVRFESGREIRLQDLMPGQRATVLQLSSEQPSESVPYERPGVPVR